MKEQKNIERLFQEKFKDFEVAPPEMAWENIKSKLNKKEKKRRVIPYWFKPFGIAASLLIGLYTYMYFNDDGKIKSEKNNIDYKRELKNNSSEIDQNNESSALPNNSIVTENEYIEKNKKTGSNVYAKEINAKDKFYNTKATDKRRNLKKVVASSNKLEKDINGNYENLRPEDNSGLNNVLSNNIKSNAFEDELQFNNSTLAKSEKNSELNNSLNQIKNNSNRSVFILEKSNANITQDSSIVAKVSDEVSALEQLLKEKEAGKNAEEKEKRDRWGVSTNAAPVYFNSVTNGSPINTQFSENSKSYTSTLSYGVGVNYNISEKLSLRTGINSLKLEYNTNDVSYSTSLKNSPNDGSMLSRNSNGQNIIFFNRNDESTTTLSSDVENFVQNNVGKLNQTTSYYEIPVELSYKLIDKKFGLEFIGGMSSLFLNQNSISLLSEGREMEIGEANNLNKVHFSSNVGIGFKYSFFKSFEVNFNPMFKYQLNTYTDNSGNFKPYFIGLYSGLSYKF